MERLSTHPTFSTHDVTQSRGVRISHIRHTARMVSRERVFREMCFSVQEHHFGANLTRVTAQGQ